MYQLVLSQAMLTLKQIPATFRPNHILNQSTGFSSQCLMITLHSLHNIPQNIINFLEILVTHLLAKESMFCFLDKSLKTQTILMILVII